MQQVSQQVPHSHWPSDFDGRPGLVQVRRESAAVPSQCTVGLRIHCSMELRMTGSTLLSAHPFLHGNVLEVQPAQGSMPAA